MKQFQQKINSKFSPFHVGLHYLSPKQCPPPFKNVDKKTLNTTVNELQL